jgi:hypothetical protein
MTRKVLLNLLAPLFGQIQKKLHDTGVQIEQSPGYEWNADQA